MLRQTGASVWYLSDYFTAKADRGRRDTAADEIKIITMRHSSREIQRGPLIHCEIIRATVESIITVANLFNNEDAQK